MTKPCLSVKVSVLIYKKCRLDNNTRPALHTSSVGTFLTPPVCTFLTGLSSRVRQRSTWHDSSMLTLSPRSHHELPSHCHRACLCFNHSVCLYSRVPLLLPWHSTTPAPTQLPPWRCTEEGVPSADLYLYATIDRSRPWWRTPTPCFSLLLFLPTKVYHHQQHTLPPKVHPLCCATRGASPHR